MGWFEWVLNSLSLLKEKCVVGDVAAGLGRAHRPEVCSNTPVLIQYYNFSYFSLN